MTTNPRPVRRAALLGAVAVVALGGVALDVRRAPLLPGFTGAHAETASTAFANPGSFADVVDKVKGAVVAVKVKVTETADEESEQPQMPQLQPGDPLEKFFKRFGQGGGSPQGKPRTGMALGSGFIISSDGYVVTNNHVVEHASDVALTMDNGKTVAAKVVGTDKKTDLALLKITEGADYPHVDFSPTVPRVGDWVIAVGNPFGLGGTVTAGIVSARGRDIGNGPYDDYLQIDAPVNRGNSGGPTFDGSGRVVGVNTAIYSPSGGSVGIGFAIPSEVAKDVVASLKANGSVARGYIGVQIQPVGADIAESLGLKSADGALVADAQRSSPAAQAGVRSGDVITAVNGEPIGSPRDLARKIAGLGPEKSAELTLWRDGASKTVQVKLGALPNDQVANAAPTQPERQTLDGLGLSLAPASSVAGAGRDGVVVADIDGDGLAAQKGMKTGDVILEAAGRPVSRPSDVTGALAQARKDGRRVVLLKVRSGDQTRFVALSLSRQAG